MRSMRYTDKVILITNKDSAHYRVKQSSLRAKEWLDKYNVNHIEKSVQELTYDDIKYIVELMELLIQNGSILRVSDVIRIHSRLNRDKVRKSLLERGINCYDIQEHQVVDAIWTCPDILCTPIVLRGEIAVIGFSEHEYPQFLTGKERYNKRWLGADENLTDEEKVDWIIKNFKPPRYIKIDDDNSRLYFPKTSILYEGDINWDVDNTMISSNGSLIKRGRTQVKMSVSLGDVFREKSFSIDIR